VRGQAQRELPQLVAARRPTGGLAGTLDGRQQEADEHGDDRDHDEQLDEGKRPNAADTLMHHDCSLLTILKVFFDYSKIEV
jgi:hypothetical protein